MAYSFRWLFVALPGHQQQEENRYVDCNNATSVQGWECSDMKPAQSQTPGKFGSRSLGSYPKLALFQIQVIYWAVQLTPSSLRLLSPFWMMVHWSSFLSSPPTTLDARALAHLSLIVWPPDSQFSRSVTQPHICLYGRQGRWSCF